MTFINEKSKGIELGGSGGSGGGSGSGDMLKSIYDKNNNGIVDDSKKLGGVDASEYDRIYHVENITKLYDLSAISSHFPDTITNPLVRYDTAQVLSNGAFGVTVELQYRGTCYDKVIGANIIPNGFTIFIGFAYALSNPRTPSMWVRVQAAGASAFDQQWDVYNNGSWILPEFDFSVNNRFSNINVTFVQASYDATDFNDALTLISTATLYSVIAREDVDNKWLYDEIKSIESDYMNNTQRINLTNHIGLANFKIKQFVDYVIVDTSVLPQNSPLTITDSTGAVFSSQVKKVNNVTFNTIQVRIAAGIPYKVYWDGTAWRMSEDVSRPLTFVVNSTSTDNDMPTARATYVLHQNTTPWARESAVVPFAGNVNTLTANGTFIAESTATNLPIASACVIMVVSDGTRVKQIALNMTAAGTFQRSSANNGGTWGAWA